MDKKIREILGEKIRKSISAKDEIISLVNSLEPEDAPVSYTHLRAHET